MVMMIYHKRRMRRRVIEKEMNGRTMRKEAAAVA
jgi:hypothetical protein